jgi:hypothetical protein
MTAPRLDRRYFLKAGVFFEYSTISLLRTSKISAFDLSSGLSLSVFSRYADR